MQFSSGFPRHAAVSGLSTACARRRAFGRTFRFDLDRREISYIPISTWLSRYVRYGHLPFRGEPADFRARNDVSEKDEIEFAKFIGFFRSSFPFPDPPPFVVNALDPHSPTCERVYSVLPPYLEDLESGLRSDFARFGSRMKLWNDITTETAPDSRGSKVMVEIASGLRNLADVGYGVHSLLPLINAIAGPKSALLLQQPEIHLHPEAQAHMAQFMAEKDQNFIIETHSDHFVDRFRICVMDGTLRPEDLSIVYFERHGTKCRIHTIPMDSEANLLDVPKSYRTFFLKETERLLGLKR